MELKLQESRKWYAGDLNAVPQSLGRSALLWSEVPADQGSQQHPLRDMRSISAEKQPQNTVSKQNNWSVTCVLIGTDDIVARGFYQAGPGCVCERLQVPAKGQ